MTISDSEFVQAVESCELESLSHRDHIRLAWLVLREQPLTNAIDTLCRQFKSYAASKGSPEVFHETITWAFVVLINERIQRGLGGAGWEEFLALNPDLSQGKRILYDYYDAVLLDTEIARHTFILPNARPRNSSE